MPPEPDAFFDEIYRELRGIASRALRAQRASHTLQPTALVHEVWLKLERGDGSTKDRAHFLAVASLAMRQILSDHARGKRALKRGVREVEAPDASRIAVADEEVDIVALDDALSRLAETNERHGRIAELRILGGLTVDETAKELGVSPRTVDTDWRFARAWLRSELGG